MITHSELTLISDFNTSRTFPDSQIMSKQFRTSQKKRGMFPSLSE
jgi:hypothetical protein